MSRPAVVAASSVVVPSLRAALHAWIALGVVVLALLPTSAWHNHWVGWLPYWALVAPLISLALLRRARPARAWATGSRRTRRRGASAVRRDGAPRRRARVALASREALIGG